MTILHGARRLFLTLVAAALAACAPADDEAAPPMDSLVTAEWLMQELGAPDLVVLDASVLIRETDDGVEVVSGHPSYEESHIPGARFADLMVDLADVDSPLRVAVPTPEAFAAAMGRLGVGDDSRVVIYDDSNSAWAARVWWMLRWIGFDNAALLDGGLQAWKDAGGAIEQRSPLIETRELSVNLRPELIVGQDDVRAVLDDDSVTLIDSLPEEHYRGDFTMYARPGHIAGATNIPVTQLTDDSGHYRPLDEVATLFDGDTDGRVITYCGGGIAASSNAFVMHRLGYRNVSVYTASLQEWAADPDNPMETE